MTDMMTTTDNRVSVRLTPAERDALDAICWENRVSLSELLRVGVAHVLADPSSAPRRTRPQRAPGRRDED